MKIVFFAEQRDGKLASGVLAGVAATQILAKHVGGSVALLIVGSGAGTAAAVLSKFNVSELLIVEDTKLNDYEATLYQQLFLEVSASEQPTYICFAANSTGRDLAPRIAAKLDAGMVSDVLSFNSDGSFRRAMYAGNVLADVEVLTDRKVLTFRPSAFSQPESGNAPKRDISINLAIEGRAKVISRELVESARPDLSSAKIVVSGGRALKSAENFDKLVGGLADVLGAAVGASRAAVDSGYASNDLQVGQTGKIVAPNLYIALGISGAIQHLAGMKDSKTIVAINKDKEAPIFELAHYGLVADIFEAIPAFIAEVKNIAPR